MVKRIRCEIIFDDGVEMHFAAIERKDHSAIFDAIEQQLLYEAAVQSRNRKPIRTPNTLGATWELRCGLNNRYRVFYDMDNQAGIVVILAVGRKVGNVLWIGEEELIL
jgi:mRNA-degrading endonuclease RelE of RelBE toxin-antitoxin system